LLTPNGIKARRIDSWSICRFDKLRFADGAGHFNPESRPASALCNNLLHSAGTV
jgi:hypothetical protein